MFYVLYGSDTCDTPDGSDLFLIAWCENYYWITEYASTIEEDADFDLRLVEYPCHTVSELEDVIRKELLLPQWERLSMNLYDFRLYYIPFQNTDDYLLVVAYDYGVLNEWDGEVVDSFVWTLENELLIPLLVLSKVMDLEVKQVMTDCLHQIHHIGHQITDAAYRGRYADALDMLDGPALYKYFLPPIYSSRSNHAFDIFHVKNRRINHEHRNDSKNDAATPIHGTKTQRSDSDGYPFS